MSHVPSVGPFAAHFPVRRLNFAFSELPKYVYDDNPLETCLWVAIQALFPDGEQFFIDAVRDVRSKVDDPDLQRDIVAFMGQEAVHGRAHRKANDCLSAERGIDVKTTERRAKAILALIARLHTPMQRLAMTAGAEHFTSTLARFMMENPDYLAGFKHPEVRRLIQWHCLEEREHRAVAFDLFQKAGGSYWLRVTMLPWFGAMLIPLVAYETARLFLGQDDAWDRRRFRKGWRSALGRNGVIAKLGPGMKEYFRRNFHPSDDDMSHVEAEWRRELGFR